MGLQTPSPALYNTKITEIIRSINVLFFPPPEFNGGKFVGECFQIVCQIYYRLHTLFFKTFLLLQLLVV